MTTIYCSVYCSECNEAVTMHADYSFTCGCEGPIELKDGGDPMPDSWRGYQMDADEIASNIPAMHWYNIGQANECAVWSNGGERPCYQIAKGDYSLNALNALNALLTLKGLVNAHEQSSKY